MPAKNVDRDPSCSFRPSGRRLFEYMMAVEVRVFPHGPAPFFSQNNVRFGFIGKNQKEFRIDSLGENPADDGNHRGDAGASRHESHSLGHSIHPMAALVRSADEHRIADPLIVQVCGDDAGCIAFHGEVKKTGYTGQ